MNIIMNIKNLCKPSKLKDLSQGLYNYHLTRDLRNLICLCAYMTVLDLIDGLEIIYNFIWLSFSPITTKTTNMFTNVFVGKIFFCA